MDALSFTFVDILVVAVILISAAFAAYRGFVQESLSIFSWAAAAFAALYFGPAVLPLLAGTLSGWTAVVAAYAGVFVIVVIPLSFISFRFAESVRRSPVHALDRSLGFVFGVVRGLVIIGAIYLVFSVAVPIPRQPDWITKARLLPLIQDSGEVLLALLPEQDLKGKARESAGLRRQRHDAARGAQRTRKEKSYGARDRRALDKLIESTANGGGKKP